MPSHGPDTDYTLDGDEDVTKDAASDVEDVANVENVEYEYDGARALGVRDVVDAELLRVEDAYTISYKNDVTEFEAIEKAAARYKVTSAYAYGPSHYQHAGSVEPSSSTNANAKSVSAPTSTSASLEVCRVQDSETSSILLTNYCCCCCSYPCSFPYPYSN